MAYEFGLLETGFNAAPFNMGLDEALLNAVSQGSSLPTLRFYGWNPPAVSLGYFRDYKKRSMSTHAAHMASILCAESQAVARYFTITK